MLPEVLLPLRPYTAESMIDATFGAGGYTGHDGSRCQGHRASTGIRMPLRGQRSSSVRTASYSGAGPFLQPGCDCRSGWLTKRLMGRRRYRRFLDADRSGRARVFVSKDGPARYAYGASRAVRRRMSSTHSNAPTLPRIIGILGEERQASRVSAEIVQQREKHPFETTLQLAKCVEKVLGRKPGDRIHPATRTFQALRIHVNGELEELASALMAAERV